MANLSDLAASLAAPASVKPVPDWISALGASTGFVAYDPFSSGENHGACEGNDDSDEAANASEDLIAAAFREGEEAGRKAAQAEYDRLEQGRAPLALQFRKLDEAAIPALEDALKSAVSELCLQLIQPHLINPEELSRRCREAAILIGQSASGFTLQLHPDDIPLLDQDLTQTWDIRPEPTLARGALRLENREGSITDGPDEWRRTIAAQLRI